MLRQEDRAVHLVGDTLRRGALALQRNSTLLAQQLLGRLRASAAPGLKPLLTEAAASGGHIWLRPLTASLIPAGDPLCASLSGHKGTVRSVAISRDGRRAASAGNSHPDQTLRLWDLEVGTELACHSGYAQAGGYTALCITPDSMYALSSLAAEVIVWDLGTGERVHVLRGHKSQVTALATAAGRALSGSTDGEVIMWDLRELKAIGQWRQQHETAWSVAISGDGCRGATATSERVIVWDLDTGRFAQRVQKTGFDGPWASPPLEFDAEAKRLRFGDPLVEWSVGTDRLRHLTKAATSGILAIDEAATLALRFVEDDGMSVWNLQSGSRIRRLPGIKAVAAVDITPDARWAIDTAFTHEVRLWDLELLKTERPGNESLNPIYGVDITPDGAHVVLRHDMSAHPRPTKGRSSVMPSGSRSVWDMRTGSRLPEAAAQKVLRRRRAVKRAAVAGPPIRQGGHDQYSEFTLEFGDNKVAAYKDEGWTVNVEDRATGERLSTFDCDAPLVACGAVGSTLVVAEVSGRVHFLKLEGAGAKEHSSSVGVRRPRSRTSR
jgi:WD40 repeat protein